MEPIADRNYLEKWINHPVYFLFCLTFGIYLWSFSFPEHKPLNPNIQLSSFAENLAQVQKNERNIASQMTDNKKHRKELPKKFRGNPAFIFFEKVEKLIDQ